MCMIDNSDGPLEMYRSKIVKARKDHSCAECGRVISRGESYDAISGHFDGRFVDYPTCEHCQVAAEWLRQECSGYLFTGVGEDILDHLGEGYGFDLARLAVGMRRKWVRFDGAGLMPIPKLPKLS